MSRKTAVCVLLAVFLSVVGTAAPAQAMSWTADGPTAIAAETSPSMDPDGWTALDPTLGSAFLKYLVSLVLGPLVA